MVITITSLRLRKLWHFFLLSYRAMFITLQARRTAGFIRMKNTGFGYLHFTITAWESDEAMRQFSRSGKHLEAMRSAASIATEVRTLTFVSDAFPDWAEARQRLFEDGKVISFNEPTEISTGNSAGAATKKDS